MADHDPISTRKTGASTELVHEEPSFQAPTLEELDELREAIEGELTAGDGATAIQRLCELRSVDRAHIFEELDPDGRNDILVHLSTPDVADLIEYLDREDAVAVAQWIGSDRLAEILDLTRPHVAADLLRSIEWEEASQVLARMRDRKGVGAVLIYGDEDAGGLMSPEVPALREDVNVARAMSMLRNLAYPRENIRQLFVVDHEGKLVGQLDLSSLVFSHPSRMLSDIMERDVVSVETGTDQEECARLMARYDLRSLPVVDPAGHLEGAIAIEDIVDVAAAEATEDMYKMIGTGVEDRALGPIRVSVRNRLPWLTVNIGTVMVVAAFLSLFESTLGILPILAVFMPMVMNQAGVAGTQVVTVVVRSLALGETDTSDFRRLIVRELVLAAVNGTAVSVILALVVGIWQRDDTMGLIVFGSMMASYLIAAIAGVLIPLSMKRFNIDPATASGVVLTTVTDIAGGVTYLGLATTFIVLLET